MQGNRLTLLKDKNAYNVLLFTHQYTYKSENFTKELEAVKKQAEEEKEALKQEMHDCINENTGGICERHQVNFKRGKCYNTRTG